MSPRPFCLLPLGYPLPLSASIDDDPVGLAQGRSACEPERRVRQSQKPRRAQTDIDEGAAPDDHPGIEPDSISSSGAEKTPRSYSKAIRPGAQNYMSTFLPTAPRASAPITTAGGCTSFRGRALGRFEQMGTLQDHERTPDQRGSELVLAIRRAAVDGAGDEKIILWPIGENRSEAER
jgi:hypothetical protein